MSHFLLSFVVYLKSSSHIIAFPPCRCQSLCCCLRPRSLILASASYHFHLLCFHLLPFSTSPLISCIMDRSTEMPGGQAKRGQNAPAAHNTYDGPGDSDSRGRSASNAGSRARSQSRTASQTRAAQMETARSMQPEARVQQLLRNVDFGGNAYNLFSSVSCNFSSPWKVNHELASHTPLPCNIHSASLLFLRLVLPFPCYCSRLITWSNPSITLSNTMLLPKGIVMKVHFQHLRSPAP